MSREQRGLHVGVHLLGLVTGLLGPLVVLLAVEEETTKAHARAALNWQLSLLLYLVGAAVVGFVSMLTAMLVGVGMSSLLGPAPAGAVALAPPCGIWLVMLVAFGCNLVFCLVAAVRASEGRVWSYPLAIPFLRVAHA